MLRAHSSLYAYSLGFLWLCLSQNKSQHMRDRQSKIIYHHQNMDPFAMTGGGKEICQPTYPYRRVHPLESLHILLNLEAWLTIKDFIVFFTKCCYKVSISIIFWIRSHKILGLFSFCFLFKCLTFLQEVREGIAVSVRKGGKIYLERQGEMRWINLDKPWFWTFMLCTRIYCF